MGLFTSGPRRSTSLRKGKEFIPDPKRFVESRLRERGLIKVDRFGKKFIEVPSSRSDFKEKFLFKGVTKSGNVNLGEIIGSGPKGDDTINVRGILKKSAIGSNFKIRTGKGTGTGFLDLGGL